MKKIFAAAVVTAALLVSAPVYAAPVCGDPGVSCDNGNPEMVVNVWGTTNSGVPHIKPGQSVINRWGEVVYCPAFISTYCVDISDTAYYIAWHLGSFGK